MCRLRALGISLPTERHVQDVPEAPGLPAVPPTVPTMSQTEMEEPVDLMSVAVARRTGYQSGDSSDDCGEVLARLRKERKKEVPSMTQSCLDDLRGDIVDLQDQMEARKPKARAKGNSDNVLEIERLRGVVCQLKEKLEQEELYAGSLENGISEVRVLQEELRKERVLCKQLKRENAEFTRFVLRDRKRGDL